MDGAGADQPGTVRVEGQPPNEIFGLLCSWYGYIRNCYRECAIPRARGLDCFHEGPGG